MWVLFYKSKEAFAPITTTYFLASSGYIASLVTFKMFVTTITHVIHLTLGFINIRKYNCTILLPGNG